MTELELTKRFLDKNNPDILDSIVTKALCFDLMVKHDIVLISDIKDYYDAYVGFDLWADHTAEYYGVHSDKSPQRAILLAAIDILNKEHK
jgi:hypothetical protein